VRHVPEILLLAQALRAQDVGAPVRAVSVGGAAHACGFYLAARSGSGAVLTALQSHDADVAIGAIAVTPESDQVVDAATLQYWAAKQGKGVVQVIGPLFRPQKYAIAVVVGSQLRKQINRALLEIYADGTYERIYSAWFAVAP
jgi:ABC-type amino acid transport substrate-binding protein